jgi:methionyl-tRNA synthetase
LDALQDEIKDWLVSIEKGWSANCVSITHSWLDQGLKPRGITRDLKWGVPSMFFFSIPNLHSVNEDVC